jgi:very-short-patch-repair endonuclease
VKCASAVTLLVIQLKAKNLPRPEFEFRFHKTRKWRADLAWPAAKVLLEVDGGVWTGGRHTSGVGFSKDLEKINAATEMGYAVYRYTPAMVSSGEAIRQLERVLSSTVEIP